MAFVSNKAISNRKAFAQQLRDAVENTDFSNVRLLTRFLAGCTPLFASRVVAVYILGLDNRYAVAHVVRSVALAAACLGIASAAAVSVYQ